VTTTSKPLVLIEAPFAARTRADRKRNDAYLIAAMRDSLARGEFPYASALVFANSGVLDDNDPEHRTLGIEAGLAWGKMASLTACYVDNGLSDGVRLGIERAKKEGRPVELRHVTGWQWPPRSEP
jgi:hypothetical protein